MSESSPFDRNEPVDTRERSARPVLIGMVVVGLAVLVLLMAPGSPLRGSGTELPGSAGSSSSASGKPSVPEGYEALSRVVSPTQPKDVRGPYTITVPLIEPVTDGRNIGLYSNRNGNWERVSTAVLDAGGATASGDVAEVPARLAVLRRTTAAALVSGWLPAGAQVDATAAEIVSVINPVAYSPNADGTLGGNPPAVNAAGKTVVPTIRAALPAQVDAVSTVLSSPQLRDAHVAALVQASRAAGIAGIDLDYRELAPARRPDFTALIVSLSDQLHAQGKTLTVSLPAPRKAGVSWDTGAYDWEEVARRVDGIRMLPEADPSIFYRRMDEVLTYLRPRIDLKKVTLVVGRQSREKGSDGVRSLPLAEALTMASAIDLRTQVPAAPNASVSLVGANIFQDDGASGIHWDTTAFAVAFSYPGRGGQRTVWFENSISVAFKVDLVRRFGLGGVSVDDISADPQASAIWEPLRSYAETGSVALVQPNGLLLRPAWESQGGSVEAGQRGNVVWKAPAQPGRYDVSLIVSDGVVRAAQKVSLEIRAPGAAQ